MNSIHYIILRFFIVNIVHEINVSENNLPNMI
jgi:hypothetical protein